jgi:hypothetical protein
MPTPPKTWEHIHEAPDETYEELSGRLYPGIRAILNTPFDEAVRQFQLGEDSARKLDQVADNIGVLIQWHRREAIDLEMACRRVIELRDAVEARSAIRASE